MTRLLLVIATTSVLTLPALASMKASGISKAGQAPQTWDHEPRPGDRLDRFQVVYVDDHSCPAGQIKKFTAGSKQLGVHATRECVAR